MVCLHACRYIDYMRLVLGSKARELYQSLDSVLEPPKPGTAAGQQVSLWALHCSQPGTCRWCWAGLIIVCGAKCTVLESLWQTLACPDRCKLCAATLRVCSQPAVSGGSDAARYMRAMPQHLCMVTMRPGLGHCGPKMRGQMGHNLKKPTAGAKGGSLPPCAHSYCVAFLMLHSLCFPAGHVH